MTSKGFRFALGLAALAGACALPAGRAHAQSASTCIPAPNSCLVLDQSGSFQEATVTQAGLDNAALIQQVGAADGFGAAGGNEVVLDQAGPGNRATIRQVPHATLPLYGGGHNSVRLDQTGGAVADVHQEGSYNTVAGDGSLPGLSLDGSTLTVSQIGWGNGLVVDQRNGAGAVLYQTGDHNLARITQR